METQLSATPHRGKVRDTYYLENGYLLMVATDRISVFDVVLPTGIPSKGLILAQLSAFWFGKTASSYPNHLVAMATDESAIPESVTSHKLFQALPQNLKARTMVVRQADRVDIECIARGYLAGSAWAEYRSSGTAFGLKLPAGLTEGSKLDPPIFTPTTKATEGHDMPMTSAQVTTMVGEDTAQKIEQVTLRIYQEARDYAATRGLILADTKLELGFIDGELSIIDELLTPDSSRFWDAEGYRPGQAQPNFDKQFVRDWVSQSNWNQEPPGPELSQEVVNRTTQRYLEAYRRLTGQDLEGPYDE